MKPPNRIREWRESHGLTLDELSDLTGLSASMLSRAERGERQLSWQSRLELARNLGVRIRDLFYAEEAKKMWTKEDLDAIRSAIRAGDRSVMFADRVVVYRDSESISEAEAIIAQHLKGPAPHRLMAMLMRVWKKFRSLGRLLQS